MNEILCPPSPTLSTISATSAIWKQKSPSEIIPLLKSAYTSLKAKEKELRIAATIGKSLLENNIALASSYNQLLQQSSSMITDSFDQGQDVAVERFSTKDAEIEILEQRNADLSCRLETLLSQQEESDRSHKLHTRQLEQQVEDLQHNIAHEIEQNSQTKKTLTKIVDTDIKTCCIKANLELEQLKFEFDHVNQLKTRKEKRLHEIRHDAVVLEQQCELATQEHENLKRAFEAQTQHLAELNASVEQYDALLNKLQKRGVVVMTTSDCSSVNEMELSPVYHNATFYQQNDSSLSPYIRKASAVETNTSNDAPSLVGRIKHKHQEDSFLQNTSYTNRRLLDDSEPYTENHIMYFLEQRHLREQQEEEEEAEEETEEVYLESHIKLYTKKSGILQPLISAVVFVFRWIFFTAIMFVSIFNTLKEGLNQ